MTNSSRAVVIAVCVAGKILAFAPATVVGLAQSARNRAVALFRRAARGRAVLGVGGGRQEQRRRQDGAREGADHRRLATSLLPIDDETSGLREAEALSTLCSM